MFYLLFRYSLADQKKVYEEFKSKEDVIEFIKEKRDEIEIVKIIEAGREFKLNWILKLDEIGKPTPQRRGRPKKKKDEGEKAEPEQVDQEEPDKEQEDKEKHWELCTVCGKNKVVSSNKRKICSECLQKEGEKTEGKETEEGKNGLEDEPGEQSWQLEISVDSKGRKKRKCWNPNCRKWFVIKYKGQHYHQDTCRQQHQKKVGSL